MLYMEAIIVYSKSHTKYTNKLQTQKAKFFNVKSNAIYTNHGNLQKISVSMNSKDLPQCHFDTAFLATYNDFQIVQSKLHISKTINCK